MVVRTEIVGFLGYDTVLCVCVCVCVCVYIYIYSYQCSK